MDSEGKLQPLQNAALLRYGFQGREIDEETGLYYFRNRYYSAEQGRFLTRDPLGYDEGMGLYQAFGGNPVSYGDPWGNETVQKITLPDASEVGLIINLSGGPGIFSEINILALSRTPLYFVQMVRFNAYKDGALIDIKAPGWALSSTQGYLVTNQWYLDAGYDPQTEQHADLPIYFCEQARLGIPKKPTAGKRLAKRYGLKKKVKWVTSFEDSPGPRRSSLQVYSSDYASVDYLWMEFKTFLVTKQGDTLIPVAIIEWGALTGYGQKGRDVVKTQLGISESSLVDPGGEMSPTPISVLTGKGFDPGNPSAGFGQLPTISTTITAEDLKTFSDLQEDWKKKVMDAKYQPLYIVK